VLVENTIEYAGCKSWVPLAQQVDVSGAEPVMDDQAFDRMCGELLGLLEA
jgi:hypothetical protein